MNERTNIRTDKRQGESYISLGINAGSINTLILAIKTTFVSWLVTLKIGSRSPKYSKRFRLSLRYSCASLVGIKTKMQEIYYFL